MSGVPPLLPSSGRRRLARRSRHPLRGVPGWRVGMLAVLVLVLIVLVSVLASLLAPFAPAATTLDATLKPPSLTHLFGTDQYGRDVLSRTIWGGQLTLLIGFASVGISAGIGVPLGLAAGYFGRWFGGTVMRLMDILLAFPGLLLALVIVAITGPGLGNVIIAIGVAFIPVFVRLVYSATLAAKQNDYVTAARLVGSGPSGVMGRHILPNIAGQVIVVASSALGWAILTGATLNFLGFGVQPPTPEWGADLASTRDYLNVAWWASTFPGLAITITILAANFAGDYLAAVIDPRHRGLHSAADVAPAALLNTETMTTASGA